MQKQRVTLKEVAAQAGVSYQTVSKVLNGQVQVAKETEERIWQAAQTLGYRPSYTARSLRSQRSQTIGYAWEPSSPDQANPIMEEFWQSIFQAAEQNGYYLLCFLLSTDPEQRLTHYQELIDTGRVDAFVLSHIEYDDDRVNFLCERDFPFVAFGRSNQDLCFPYMDVDGGDGMKQVVRHLVEQGHRRIGMLAWPESSRVGDNRLEGYYAALQEAGITPLAQWLQRGEGTNAFGQAGANHLLDLPVDVRPTALVAVSDMVAVGAMTAIRERGLQIGADVAVTGFDDTPLARYLSPALTSVCQPVWEIGQQLMSVLFSVIEGKTQETYTPLVAPKLVVRESSLRR